MMDFWINLWFLSNIFLAIYLIVEFIWIPEHAWLRLVLVIISIMAVTRLAYLQAVAAGIQWGNGVKSAFDVYLFDLYEKLRFAKSPEATVRQEQWKNFNQAVLYRTADKMPIRKPPDISEE